MSAARRLSTPLSGRDRRHYYRELDRAKSEQERMLQEAERAYENADKQLAKAYRFECLAYNARLFGGGPDKPSPSIAKAIKGGVPLLEIQCDLCSHTDMIDLSECIWPREYAIHTLAVKLYCRSCKKEHLMKRRPLLIGLLMREEPKD